MGRFFSNVQIKYNEDPLEFKNSFCDLMKKRGLVSCGEDEAVLSYLLAFSDNGWVTLVSKDYSENPKKANEDSKQIASALKTSAFSVEVVDSDFAFLRLSDPNGGDEVIVGDGSGYGIEELPRGTQGLWQPLIAKGRTWEQFTETVAKNEVFVEDKLEKLAEILEIEPSYICADYDDITEKGGNVLAFYFKKAAAKAKTMSLNAAFKQVFGEALEPLGFKLIKSKYPYFVRVVSNEIVHYVTFANETADGRGTFGVKYKCFSIYCGVSTVYNSKIDFDTDPRKLFFCGLNSVFQIYTKSHWYDLDNEYCSSIYEFYYNPTSTEDMLKVLKRALKVTEDTALPVINPAVTLKKCMDYFGIMEQNLVPSLDGSGDGLLSTRLFTIDDYVIFRDKITEREIKQCYLELHSNTSLSSKRRRSLEERIKYIMEKREERKKSYYKIFDNPEMHEMAPAEMERRKKENVDRLRAYGLNI